MRLASDAPVFIGCLKTVRPPLFSPADQVAIVVAIGMRELEIELLLDFGRALGAYFSEPVVVVNEAELRVWIRPPVEEKVQGAEDVRLASIVVAYDHGQVGRRHRQLCDRSENMIVINLIFGTGSPPGFTVTRPKARPLFSTRSCGLSMR